MMTQKILSSRAALGRSGVVCAIGMAFVLGSSSRLYADLIYHNGSVRTGGAGNVDVDFQSNKFNGSVFAASNFREQALLIESFGAGAFGEPDMMFFQLEVRNSTDQAWKAYNIGLFGADILGYDVSMPVAALNLTASTSTAPQSTDVLFMASSDPSEIGIRSSEVTRDVDRTSLTINFDEVIRPNDSFELSFWVLNPDLTGQGFVMHQSPSVVPVPGAALLGMLGLGTVGLIRRRFA